jgi:hypothetical protein
METPAQKRQHHSTNLILSPDEQKLLPQSSSHCGKKSLLNNKNDLIETKFNNINNSSNNNNNSDNLNEMQVAVGDEIKIIINEVKPYDLMVKSPPVVIVQVGDDHLHSPISTKSLLSTSSFLTNQIMLNLSDESKDEFENEQQSKSTFLKNNATKFHQQNKYLGISSPTATIVPNGSVLCEGSSVSTTPSISSQSMSTSSSSSVSTSTLPQSPVSHLIHRNMLELPTSSSATITGPNSSTLLASLDSASMISSTSSRHHNLNHRHNHSGRHRHAHHHRNYTASNRQHSSGNNNNNDESATDDPDSVSVPVLQLRDGFDFHFDVKESNDYDDDEDDEPMMNAVDEHRRANIQIAVETDDMDIDKMPINEFKKSAKNLQEPKISLAVAESSSGETGENFIRSNRSSLNRSIRHHRSTPNLTSINDLQQHCDNSPLIVNADLNEIILVSGGCTGDGSIGADAATAASHQLNNVNSANNSIQASSNRHQTNLINNSYPSNLELSTIHHSLYELQRNIVLNNAKLTGNSKLNGKLNLIINNNNNAKKFTQRYKLLVEGDVHVCKLPHSRNVISKILNSKLLRRWKAHRLVLSETEIFSTTVRVFFRFSVFKKYSPDLLFENSTKNIENMTLSLNLNIIKISN